MTQHRHRLMSSSNNNNYSLISSQELVIDETLNAVTLDGATEPVTFFSDGAISSHVNNNMNMNNNNKKNKNMDRSDIMITDRLSSSSSRYGCEYDCEYEYDIIEHRTSHPATTS